MLCFSVGVVALLPSLGSQSSFASVAVRLLTEFGYFLTAPALLALAPGWRKSVPGKVGALFSIAAIVLLMRPAVNALEASQTLPEDFASRFGSETRARHKYAEDAQPTLVALTRLWHPVPSRPVRYEQRSLTSRDGERLTLDIYRPQYLHGRIPVVLVIHGESWSGGIGRELIALDGYLAARDYVVVAMGGPLATGRPFTSARADVLTVVKYLKSHAENGGATLDHSAAG